MFCRCLAELTVGEGIDWRSVFINAAAGNACRHRILITPFSTLSRIFLYSEGVGQGGGGGSFLSPCRVVFLFQIRHVVTVHRQTISPR